MTVAAIAQELGVSARTLARDVAILRDRGLPVEADRGRGGGIRLHRLWGIGRLTLNHREAVVLLVSLAIAERLKSPWLIADLDSVRRKLAASFSPALKDRIDGLRRRILVDEAASSFVLKTLERPKDRCVQELFTAFLEMRCLDMTYVAPGKRGSQRVIEPHFLLLAYPVWYVLGWDRSRDGIRSFRLDRITAAQATDEPFSPQPMARFAEAIEGTGARPA